MLHFADSRASDEAHGPDATARVFNQNHMAECVGVLRQNGLHDLLNRAMDIAHDRHPSHDLLGKLNQPTAHESGS